MCAANEAVTVLSNLVATIGEPDAVATAHWLRAGRAQPPRSVDELQEQLCSCTALTRVLPHEGNFILTCSWPDKTDYDLFALVEYTDGHVEHVATFGAKGVRATSRTKDGAVVHSGD